MKISAAKLAINSDCSISAVGGSLDIDVRKKSKGIQMFADQNQLSDTDESLEKEGFVQKTELFEIKAPSKTDVTSFANFEKSLESPLSAEITVDVNDDESAIAIEYNPATGEIIDWYQADIELARSTTSNQLPLQKLLKSTETLRKRVVINVPVHTYYSTEKNAYNPTSFGLFKPKKLFKKVIKIFSFKKLKKKAKDTIAKLLAKPARMLDKKIVSSERLGKLSKNGKIRKLNNKNIKAMNGKRVLLFIHGIISNSEKAFGDLLQDKASYETLNKYYDGNILAFDHWTLTKNVFENADFVAAALPNQITLDIVCHSRGAAVTRSLVERVKSKKKLIDKSIKVDKVVFVAGACEGSDLATENALDNLFRIFTKMGAT